MVCVFNSRCWLLSECSHNRFSRKVFICCCVKCSALSHKHYCFSQAAGVFFGVSVVHWLLLEDTVKKIIIIFLQLTFYALTVSIVIILTYFVMFINAFDLCYFSDYMIMDIYFGLCLLSQHSFAFKPFSTLVS